MSIFPTGIKYLSFLRFGIKVRNSSIATTLVLDPLREVLDDSTRKCPSSTGSNNMYSSLRSRGVTELKNRFVRECSLSERLFQLVRADALRSFQNGNGSVAAFLPWVFSDDAQ